jgi:hypothetical protein
MSRFWHGLGSVLGTATTLVGALTPMVGGSTKTVVVTAGVVVTLLSNVFKAIGK